LASLSDPEPELDKAFRIWIQGAQYEKRKGERHHYSVCKQRDYPTAISTLRRSGFTEDNLRDEQAIHKVKQYTAQRQPVNAVQLYQRFLSELIEQQASRLIESRKTG
jgi:hypothetical protein